MTDFVFHKRRTMVDEGLPVDDCLQQIFNYANFLKQLLTLGMFVPCSASGEILKLPIFEDYTDCTIEQNMEDFLYNLGLYNDAKDRVLFEGEHGLYDDWCLQLEDGTLIENVKKLHKMTIEDLTFHELTLTESAIKQLGI